jgi:hypothetical protein
VYKEPSIVIPGVPAIIQHEIMNNRRHVLTKVITKFLLRVLLLNCKEWYHGVCTHILFCRILLVLSSCGRLPGELLLKTLARL